MATEVATAKTLNATATTLNANIFSVSVHAMLTLLGLVCLNVSTVFWLGIVPAGAALKDSVLLWNFLAVCGGMLPASLAVLILLRKTPDAAGLVELVASQLGQHAGAFVAVGEWVAGVVFVIPQIEFCALGVVYPLDAHLLEDGRLLAAIVVIISLISAAVVARGVEEAISYVIMPLTFIGNVIPLLILIGCASTSSKFDSDIHFKPVSPKVTGVLVGFAGLELSAFHLKSIEAAERERLLGPALVLSAVVIMLMYDVAEFLVAGLSEKGHLVDFSPIITIINLVIIIICCFC